MFGPPTSFLVLFYLVFGLIATAFVVQMVFAFRRMGSLHRHARKELVDRLEAPSAEAPQSSPGPVPKSYDCDHCGAHLESGGDVSPSGEFKCRYCGKWSSIHT